MYHSSAILALAAAFLPSTFATSWTVQVGAGGNLTYDPPFVNAVAGDIVNFVFNPKNHTVTQSAFDPPCVPLSGGATTGFVPVAAGADTPSRQFNVEDATTPIWFYCEQTGHCGKGMVFAINPPPDPNPHSFSAFQALAIARNGTTTSSTTTSSAAGSFSTPPPPHWVSATATVTEGGSTWTTTWTSYDGTPPPTPTAQPIDHKITVGADGLLAYSPSNISASIGDTVTFEFHPKNHTVTQSSFTDPCHGLLKDDGSAGFKSGFTPVSADATTFPTFQITINDTAPIWGYCGQTGHCQAGMVFSINAVESGPNNFEAFLALAKQSAPSTSNSTTGTGTGVGTSAGPASTVGPSSSGVIVNPQVGFALTITALLALAL